MDTAVKQKVDNFFAKYPLKCFDKRQIIIYGNEEPAGVYYLLKGKVRQYDISDRGEEVVVNVFKPPSFFPMIWAINKEPNEYFYETLESIEIRLAPAIDVVDFLRHDAEVTFDLLARLYSGVNGMQRRMAHLMGGSGQSRVLFELALECKRFGVKQKDGSYLLDLHEEQLANRSGLSRETVNRELVKLKNRQLIKIFHKHLVIFDLQKIEDILGTHL